MPDGLGEGFIGLIDNDQMGNQSWESLQFEFKCKHMQGERAFEFMFGKLCVKCNVQLDVNLIYDILFKLYVEMHMF